MTKIEKQVETMSDEKIIELYWQRNDNAIRETDEKYGKRIYRIAYNILGDLGESEDSKNDTYHKLWCVIPPNRPPVFPAFVARIARGIAIDKYRKKSAKKEMATRYAYSLDELVDTPDELVTEIDFDANHLSSLLNSYVRGLSPRDSFIFVSRYFACEEVEEIARELGTTTSNVYKSLTKIKRNLKKELERNGVSI